MKQQIPLMASLWLMSYHRMVFSTTVRLVAMKGAVEVSESNSKHGFRKHRPGLKGYRLEQPIRWNNNDPLEAWLFDCFLLGAASSIVTAGTKLKVLSNEKLQLTSSFEIRVIQARLFS
ncbi:hypothetical protein OH492_13030 [Vibrio chagasii]|nr:hypothetical protein [Vibrio chagasii]